MHAVPYVSYSGTDVTYYRVPTFMTEANWGWYESEQRSTKHWISNPTSAYSIGYYASRRDVGITMSLGMAGPGRTFAGREIGGVRPPSRGKR